jgi:uncharacterized membrane protein
MPDSSETKAALLSALNTEHFVQQTIIGTTTNEMASRSSMYIMALSSALVATGFVAQSSAMLLPFAAAVLPSIFLLGIFTILRLVDIAAENMQAHICIARIRAHYRTLGDTAAFHFAKEFGRWPENGAEPSLRTGELLAYLTTAATMIACINAIVAATGIALFTFHLTGEMALALTVGVASVLVLIVLFYLYQRLRTREMVRMAKAYGSEKSIL